MSWVTNMMRQSATRWPSPTADGRGGWSFGTPVAHAFTTGTGVRWQDKNELFIDANGAEQTSKSIVFLSAAAAVDEWLYLGVSVAANPQVLDGAQRIQRVDKTINTRNNRTIWKAYL